MSTEAQCINVVMILDTITEYYCEKPWQTKCFDCIYTTLEHRTVCLMTDSFNDLPLHFLTLFTLRLDLQTCVLLLHEQASASCNCTFSEQTQIKTSHKGPSGEDVGQTNIDA